jgi:hypothetical protein
VAGAAEQDEGGEHPEHGPEGEVAPPPGEAGQGERMEK